jgi:hypothetical protein
LSKEHDILVAQCEGANKVLRELTPLEGGIKELEALEGWVRMMNGKVEMITGEMKRLQDKITREHAFTLKHPMPWSAPATSADYHISARIPHRGAS